MSVTPLPGTSTDPEPNPPTTTNKKKRTPQHDAPPVRSPVKLFAVQPDGTVPGATNVELKFRENKINLKDGEVNRGKSTAFQTERKLRGDSRRNFKNGIHRHEKIMSYAFTGLFII